MSENKTSINWYPGHMAKTNRQLKEELKAVDFVIEVRDARIPLASKNPELDKIIGNKKRLIFIE